jgi:hypothetical protein
VLLILQVLSFAGGGQNVKKTPIKKHSVTKNARFWTLLTKNKVSVFEMCTVTCSIGKKSSKKACFGKHMKKKLVYDTFFNVDM